MAHFQFVFYIFCIIWNEFYLSKYLVIQLIWYANSDIRRLVFYQTQSFSFLYDCKQSKSLFLPPQVINSKKRLKIFSDRKLSNHLDYAVISISRCSHLIK